MSTQSATSGRTITARERELEAVRLRTAGQPYSSISLSLGIAKSSVHRAVTRAMARTATTLAEDAGVLRQIEIARLDALLAGLWPRATSGDVPAVHAALKVGERRARLLGLDAPARAEVTGAQGGPLEVAASLDLTRLTDDEFHALDGLLARAAA